MTSAQRLLFLRVSISRDQFTDSILFRKSEYLLLLKWISVFAVHTFLVSSPRARARLWMYARPYRTPKQTNKQTNKQKDKQTNKQTNCNRIRGYWTTRAWIASPFTTALPTHQTNKSINLQTNKQENITNVANWEKQTNNVTNVRY